MELGGENAYFIHDNAFLGESKLRHVVMLSDAYHDGVTRIGNSAFDHCNNLVSVGFTPNLLGIGVAAFGSCSSLQSVFIPKNVSTIGMSAFSDCSGLRTVELSTTSLTLLDEQVFYNCTSLKEVVIPNCVDVISSEAFSGCTGLTRITFGTGLTSVSADILSGVKLVIGGDESTVIPGSDNSERAAALVGKSFSGSSAVLRESKFNLYYVVDGVIIDTVQYEAGETVTLRAAPTVDYHTVVGWYIPGTVITDNTIEMPSCTLYATAWSLQNYYTVVIDLGDGVIESYTGPWNEVDSHTYAMDVAAGTDVTSITTNTLSPIYFDSSLITLPNHVFSSWLSPDDIIDGQVTIEVNYAPNQYDITLDENGGDSAGSATAVYGETSLSTLVHSARQGYTLLGYYSLASDGVKIVNANGTFVAGIDDLTDSNGRWIGTSNTTFFAYWEANTFTVTLDKNGGSDDGSATATYDSNTLTGFNEPVRANYHITGYYTLAEDGVLVINADHSLVASVDGYTGAGGIWIRESNTTLFAHWEGDTITITLDKNGGDASGTATVAYGSQPLVIVKAPTKTGYHIAKYRIISDGEPDRYVIADTNGTLHYMEDYTDSSNNWIRTVSTTLYPLWEADRWNLQLDKNGGDYDGTAWVRYDDTHLTFYGHPVKTNYHVEGYYTTSACTVKLADADGNFRASIGEYTDGNCHWVYQGEATFFAKWLPNTYDIRLDKNGGDEDGAAVATYLSDTLDITSAPTWAGYELSCYYTYTVSGSLLADVNGALEANVIGYTDDQGRWIGVDQFEIAARWNACEYAITIDKNGGDTGGTAIIVFNSTAMSSIVPPARSGYRLAGYSLTSSGELIADSEGHFADSVSGYTDGDGKWISTSVTKLYAVWQANPYTLTLDKNGGVSDTSTTATFDSSELTAFDNITRPGFSLTGYYTQTTGGVKVIGADKKLIKGVEGYTDANGKWTRAFNETLYAQWEEHEYTVTWYSQDGNTVLETDTGLHYGDSVSFNGSAPTKDPTTQYTYTFAGWAVTVNQTSGTPVGSLPTVTEDVSYYAAFSVETRSYTIRFMNYDGTELQSSSVAYGQTPAYTQSTPVKPADSYHTYTFAGWDPQIVAVAGDATYTAQFTPVIRTYDVSFNSNGGTGSMDGVKTDAGDYTLPACTITAPDGKHFSGWALNSASGDEYQPGSKCTVTSDVTFYALWAAHDYDDVVTDPTCTDEGYTTHTCKVCGYHYVDSQTPALGHSYSATYDWSADGKNCIVHIVCARNAAHNHDVTDAAVSSIVKTPAAVGAMGVTTYSVSGTYDGFAYGDSKDVTDIPALEPEPVEKEIDGVKTYTNTVTENQTTQVTEIFNTAKENSGAVEMSFSKSVSETPLTITFDKDAVNSIAGNAVTIAASVVENSTVTDAELVIEVKLDGATFSGGKAKVAVPLKETVPEGKTVKVYFINGSEKTDMNATLVDGKAVFETNHFSTYAVFYEDAPSENGGGFPIGIVIGIVIAVVVVGAVAFFLVKKH